MHVKERLEQSGASVIVRGITTQSRGPPWKHGIQASYHPARRSLILVVRYFSVRAFKHIRKNKQAELFDMFPVLLSDDFWRDHESTSFLPFSIWDHWLIESGSQHVLNEATQQQEEEWNGRFTKLTRHILENTEVFYIKHRKHKRFPTFKATRSLPEAITSFCNPGGFLNGYRFSLAIPELEVIYSIGDDFTGFVYYRSSSNLAKFLEWVELSGLKVIKSYLTTQSR